MTDLGRFRARLERAARDEIDRAARRIAAQADLVRIVRAAARGDEGRRGMSILDKLELVAQRRAAHEQHMADRADATLARYAVLGTKVDRAFDKHDQRLDAEEAAIAATEEAIDRLSNAAEDGGGNSSGSGQSPEPPGGTGKVV